MKIGQNRNNRKWATKEWVDECSKIYNGLYDYSKVNYVDNHTKVCIICPIHGEFWKIPTSHMYKKQGCQKCASIKSAKYRGLTNEKFIDRANKLHGGKYDYSKVEYVNTETEVCIICPKHGEFWKSPHNHLSSNKPQGCPICSKIKNVEKHKKTETDFINECINLYGDKFTYEKVNYVKSNIKVTIHCKEHGYFDTFPYNLLNLHGCPKCTASIMELKCISFFEHNNIRYEKEKKFDWLKDKGSLRLDFYLPDYNIAIECQGIQHFKPRDRFGGFNEFEKTKERDELKNKLCNENNIKIEYIIYNENVEKRIFEILRDTDIKIKP